MKRILLLITLVMLILFTACSDDNDKETSTNDDNEIINEDNNDEVTDENQDESDSEVTSDQISFTDVINNDNTYNNYYFELEITDGVQEVPNIKIWVMDNSMKWETPDQIIYSTNGSVAMYLKESNQLMVSPANQPMDTVTPFSLVSDIDDETYDYINYKGAETLDGKKVHVYENTAPEFNAKYYIWDQTGIIVKMEASYGSYSGTYYFKDLELGKVTESDFSYPDGAEIIDLNSLGIE